MSAFEREPLISKSNHFLFSINSFLLFPLVALSFVLSACGANSKSFMDPRDDSQNESQASNLSRSVLVPEVRGYNDTLQVKVTLEEKFLWSPDSDEARRGLVFKPIDYRTLMPTDRHGPGVVGITTYTIVPRYLSGESGILQEYDRYPDIGETRFGLSYRPDAVPGRPEELWKRNYLRRGIPGEEFYIGCTPPVGPGSIVQPTECGMTIMLSSKEVTGRRAGIMVIASVPAAKIEDWVQVEAAIRTLLGPNVAWFEGKLHER
jgi:hypothetical protein